MRGYVVGLFLMLVAGCGGDALSGGESAKFDGTWSQTGNIEATCTMVGTQQRAMSGDVVCSSSDGEVGCASKDPACTWRFTVDGDTATLKSNQTCTIAQSGANIVLSPKTWTMTLGSGGTTATATASGDATATVSGVSIPCTFTASANMTRAQ